MSGPSLMCRPARAPRVGRSDPSTQGDSTSDSGGMDKLIVVSGDSHAVVPPELWPEYVEAQYHDYLPGLQEDNERYQQLLGLFANFTPDVLAVIDPGGIWPYGGQPR